MHCTINHTLFGLTIWFTSVTWFIKTYTNIHFYSLTSASRCRDGERSGENEVFSGREGEPSSPVSSSRPSSTSSSKDPLKVMPAPPPKENAWAKRSAVNSNSSDGDGRPPVSPVSPGGSAPLKLR